MDEKELYINFDEYIRQGEPDQKEKAGYWQAAIGLGAGTIVQLQREES